MQTIEQTLQAGVEVPFHAPGTFFRLLSTSAPLDVVFYRDGKEIARASAMEAGYAETMPEGFDKLTIKSATVQTAKFIFRQGGTVGYDRMAGEVTLSGGDFANAEKTVTNADGQLIAANAARKYLLIQNNGAGSIFIKFGAGAATLTNGVKVSPGNSYELSGYVARNEVRAIGDIASNAAIVTVEG